MTQTARKGKLYQLQYIIDLSYFIISQISDIYGILYTVPAILNMRIMLKEGVCKMAWQCYPMRQDV
jgi:hypothetical protein